MHVHTGSGEAPRSSWGGCSGSSCWNFTKIFLLIALSAGLIAEGVINKNRISIIIGGLVCPVALVASYVHRFCCARRSSTLVPPQESSPPPSDLGEESSAEPVASPEQVKKKSVVVPLPPKPPEGIELLNQQCNAVNDQDDLLAFCKTLKEELPKYRNQELSPIFNRAFLLFLDCYNYSKHNPEDESYKSTVNLIRSTLISIAKEEGVLSESSLDRILESLKKDFPTLSYILFDRLSPELLLKHASSKDFPLKKSSAEAILKKFDPLLMRGERIQDIERLINSLPGPNRALVWYEMNQYASFIDHFQGNEDCQIIHLLYSLPSTPFSIETEMEELKKLMVHPLFKGNKEYALHCKKLRIFTTQLLRKRKDLNRTRISYLISIAIRNRVEELLDSSFKPEELLVFLKEIQDIMPKNDNDRILFYRPLVSMIALFTTLFDRHAALQNEELRQMESELVVRIQNSIKDFDPSILKIGNSRDLLLRNGIEDDDVAIKQMIARFCSYEIPEFNDDFDEVADLI